MAWGGARFMRVAAFGELTFQSRWNGVGKNVRGEGEGKKKSVASLQGQMSHGYSLSQGNLIKETG